MMTLIIKTLNDKHGINKNALMDELAKQGILASDEFTQKLLDILESQGRITKLSNGEYVPFPHNVVKH